ncbi:hypothetical protein [Treponema pedis]|nr:hypothetical protein [Treponema pedis]
MKEEGVTGGEENFYPKKLSSPPKIKNRWKIMYFFGIIVVAEEGQADE